jgi:hypothetical protein
MHIQCPQFMTHTKLVLSPILEITKKNYIRISSPLINNETKLIKLGQLSVKLTMIRQNN